MSDTTLFRAAPPRLIAIRDMLRRQNEERLRELATKSLYEFFKQAWPNFDPADYNGNWHLQVMAERLEAVNRGEVPRLLINVPPRTSKSNLVSVVWPVWTWIQEDTSILSGPRAKFLSISYSSTLAMQNTERSRRLMGSRWFQHNFGDRFGADKDTDRKADFVNTHGGARITTSVGGTLTGLGGDLIILDDPNSATGAESQAEREAANLWFKEALPTRLNDPKKGAMVVVQQRLHESDVTGSVLSGDDAERWEHLMFPMRYDARRPCAFDIRQKDGELLWPQRFGEREVKTLEASLGPYAAAGQLQQLPSPRGGGIIKREWWLPWSDGKLPDADFVIAALDTAMTEKETSDFSALTVFRAFTASGSFADDPDGEFGYDFITGNYGHDDAMTLRQAATVQGVSKAILVDGWAERLDLTELAQRVMATCRKNRVDMLVIENKARGHDVHAAIRRLMRDRAFQINMMNPTVDKMQRLYAVQPIFSQGFVHAPDTEFAEKVITEVAAFPKAAHDDLTDTVSMCLTALRQRGFLAYKGEIVRRVEREVKHRGIAKPLYPA